MIGILGASGYIGQAFVQELIDQNVSFREFSRKKDNYYSLKDLAELIDNNGISVLINCAGYTGKPNVDACEDNKDECYKGNVELAKTVATACSITNATLLHISSGCIYTGDNNGAGFTEEDEPNFHALSEITGSFYSNTKTIAESIIESTWEKSYIARLRIPFDNIDSPRNYLSKLQNYEKLLGAVNSISHRKEFVQACIHLAKEKCDYGIYNIVNTDPVNTEQVAELLKEYKLIDSYDILTEKEFYKNIDVKAPRSNCVLDNSKLINSGFKVKASIEAVEDCLKNWKNE
tara:strand:+ start:945 stop:1814 length:870 start_codon:yes stop_codon:yes gene_type:complete